MAMNGGTRRDAPPLKEAHVHKDTPDAGLKSTDHCMSCRVDSPQLHSALTQMRYANTYNDRHLIT